MSLNVSFPAYKEGGSHDLWPIKQMQLNECANYMYLVTPAGEDFDKNECFQIPSKKSFSKSDPCWCTESRHKESSSKAMLAHDAPCRHLK